MKRVYGYKRRHAASGRRYQDGYGAQTRAEKDKVIEGTALVDAPVVEKLVEEVEIADHAAVRAQPPVVEQLIDDTNEDHDIVPAENQLGIVEEELPKEMQVGDLPDHLTGFMDMDAKRPSLNDKEAEEDIEVEEEVDDKAEPEGETEAKSTDTLKSKSRLKSKKSTRGN